MIQRCSRIVLFLLLLPLLQSPSAVSADTITLTFDDLDPLWSNNYPIYNGYAGLNWYNFSSMYVASQFSAQSLNGYYTGMVSPYFIAYNQDGGPAEFGSDTPFKFVSVYLTAAWQSDLQITVEGFLGGTLLYSQTVQVPATVPTLFTFNYNGVDRVRFTSSGTTPQWPDMGDGTQFAMDNLTLGAAGSTDAAVTTIDIKPGSKENPVNPGSNGVIPVAILSTDTFSAPDLVDISTLTFGHSGDEQSLAKCHIEDVDNDGLVDLICHFSTEKTGFVCGDSEGVLKGKTTDTTAFEGRDTVKIVPCK